MLTFNKLVVSITNLHQSLSRHASKAVNISLTARNWFIGYYIDTYEHRGRDRARYGEKLMDHLAARLEKARLSNCNRRELYRYLAFYRTYPGIVGTLSPQFGKLLPPGSVPSRIVGTPYPLSAKAMKNMLETFSYSHFELLVGLDDAAKRVFYERQCFAAAWSVRELRRQIATLLFERSRLSKKKRKLASLVARNAEKDRPEFTVRNPYVFEFLGFKAKEVMGESDLEDALLDKLHDFLLELGHGFCFEARQKRISIGGDYFFVDLVFYHRILKCHVLIELKTDEFKHEHLGQLNTYVNWYRKNVMMSGDSPPVGLLLCTRKNHALAEYALAGMDNKIFVTKYQLRLPKKEELGRFFEAELKASKTYNETSRRIEKLD